MVDRRPLVPDIDGRKKPVNENREVAIKVINYPFGSPWLLGRARVNAAASDQDWQLAKFRYDGGNNVVEQMWAQNDLGNASTDYDYIWDDATAINVSGITQADPGVVTTSSAHGFSDGDYVIFSSVGGMTEVNFNDVTTTVYIVANSTSTTFELTDIDGADVDTSGFTAYTSGGTVRTLRAAQYTYS